MPEDMSLVPRVNPSNVTPLYDTEAIGNKSRLVWGG